MPEQKSIPSPAPQVSWVLAVFNGERFLRAALDSILNQTFSDFECIVVDDGSTDTSWELVSAFCARDQRIKCVRQQHLGLVKALNEGCCTAGGQYIARLDADDVAKPSRLAVQVAFMENNPNLALSGGHTECIDSSNNIKFVMKWPGYSEGLADLQLLDCHIAHTTVMFRRDLFLNLGGYRAEYLHAEDYDLFLRLNDQFLIDNIPVVLSQYRLHEAQVSTRHATQQVLSGIGARLAARARRAGRLEPKWANGVVSRSDLLSLGVSSSRLDLIVQEYNSNTDYATGWRWRNKRFCQVV